MPSLIASKQQIAAETGVAVGVKLHRFAVRFAQDQRHQPARRFRRQQAAGIFETKALDIELGRFAGAFDEIRIGMFGRDRINNIQYGLEPDALGAGDRLAPVFRCVRWIGSAQFLDAVGGQAFQPKIGDRRRGDLKRQHGAAANRAQWCRLDALRQQANPFPGIVFQITHTFFVKRRRHDLDGFEAGAVEPLGDGQHHACAHVGGPKTELAIAHGGVDEINFAVRIRVIHGRGFGVLEF